MWVRWTACFGLRRQGKAITIIPSRVSIGLPNKPKEQLLEFEPPCWYEPWAWSHTTQVFCEEKAFAWPQTEYSVGYRSFDPSVVGQSVLSPFWGLFRFL